MPPWYGRGVEIVTVVAPEPRRWRWLAAAGASAVAMIAAIRLGFAHHLPPAQAALALDVETGEPFDHAVVHEQAPAEPLTTELEDRYPIPAVAGTSLDELFPSLTGWIHPVTSTTELMPEQPSRRFGASREGIERAECGAGHCGVDLDGPRGRPVVAVEDGIVVRVEHSELGLDGRSGRYVRIEHDDGTLTAYMHLDEIADGLEVGDHVDGGQYIGTLGATAVYSAPPHLHFSLEVPNHPGIHGDNTDTHYVDPAPFLVRASVVSEPDRRRSSKPEM